MSKIKNQDVLKKVAHKTSTLVKTVDRILGELEIELIREGYKSLIEIRKNNPNAMSSALIVNRGVGTWRLVALRGAGLEDGTLKPNELGGMESYETYRLVFDDSRAVTDREIAALKAEMAIESIN